MKVAPRATVDSEPSQFMKCMIVGSWILAGGGGVSGRTVDFARTSFIVAVSKHFLLIPLDVCVRPIAS